MRMEQSVKDGVVHVTTLEQAHERRLDLQWGSPRYERRARRRHVTPRKRARNAAQWTAWGRGRGTVHVRGSAALRSTSSELERGAAVTVQSRAIACNHVQSRAIACSHVQSRTVTCNRVQSRAIACNRVQSRAVTCNRVQSRAIACNRVQSRAVTCNLVQSHAIRCNQGCVSTLRNVSTRIPIASTAAAAGASGSIVDSLGSEEDPAWPEEDPAGGMSSSFPPQAMLTHSACNCRLASSAASASARSPMTGGAGRGARVSSSRDSVEVAGRK
mgnify:CR=1 FL=1